MVANFMSFAVHVGISLPHTSPFELPEAFSEVKKALTNSLYHDIPISFFNPSDPDAFSIETFTHTHLYR